MAKLKVTLLKSTNNVRKNQYATVKALGLNKIGQTAEVEDNAATRGMVKTVAHLVRCEEA
ncbi:MAG: 50S ribosomal protein L30 [Saccharofermentanales bacterium]|nr:50S ribosomal protein L30 [Oscillospiraceae bacterium]